LTVAIVVGAALQTIVCPATVAPPLVFTTPVSCSVESTLSRFEGRVIATRHCVVEVEDVGDVAGTRITVRLSVVINRLSESICARTMAHCALVIAAVDLRRRFAMRQTLG
jgi:hypothetical protein